MVSMGQKLYFTSLIAVKNLPENYKTMASNLKWTTFNARLPWKSESDSIREVQVPVDPCSDEDAIQAVKLHSILLSAPDFVDWAMLLY